MFIFIEGLGIVVLLWFIANFVRYIAFKISGMGGDSSNALFGMSDHWILQEKKKADKHSTKGNNN